ncbi:MAG TPA: HAD family acid phosphatase [Bryobacteraceae bacterium]|nr:HAD family acid phosphatase [Bryobacteraceae bacterium]
MTLVLLTPLGSQPTAPRPDPNLNAIVWTQTSAEYGALTAQTYRAAGAALTAALADPHWTAAYEQTNDFRTLPPAVILDLDETVFDNSPSQAKLILDGKSFSEAGWAAWVKEARAGAVPGAVAFLHAARLKGVTPVYISNRLCNPADANDPTILNLKKLRVPFSTDQVLCKTDSSDKTDRRKWAASHYRILLLIGDDFNDFTATPNVVGDRAKLREFYDAMWGTKWFMLPNPAYGSWERAVGFDLADKWKALRP